MTAGAVLSFSPCCVTEILSAYMSNWFPSASPEQVGVIFMSQLSDLFEQQITQCTCL